MAIQTESRKKLHAWLDVLREVDERRYGPEWGVESVADVADGHRNLLHLLESGLFSHMESSSTSTPPAISRSCSPPTSRPATG